jgi:hypothetical protein
MLCLLQTSFYLIKGSSLSCMLMTHTCWRNFVPSWKPTSWRFAWSGLLWIQAPKWVVRIHLFKDHKSHFIHICLCILLSFKVRIDLNFFFLVDSCRLCHLSCEGSNFRCHVFLKVLVLCPFCWIGWEGY